MVPPSGVNFTAFDSRFSITWFSRTLSEQTFSADISRMRTSNFCFLAFIWGCTILTILSISSFRETMSLFNVIFPLSILDISSTSLISPKRCLLDKVIFFRQFCTCWMSSIFAVAIAVIPTIAFMGVRISWLILERNSLLA